MTTVTIATMEKMIKRNEELAQEIADFLISREIGKDVRIYFNGKCYHFTSSTEYTVLENILGSTYFEYANDETVSMSFEGSFYYVMNGYADGSRKIVEEFNKLLEKYGMYYEQGYAWSLSLYED